MECHDGQVGGDPRSRWTTARSPFPSLAAPSTGTQRSENEGRICNIRANRQWTTQVGASIGRINRALNIEPGSWFMLWVVLWEMAPCAPQSGNPAVACARTLRMLGSGGWGGWCVVEGSS